MTRKTGLQQKFSGLHLRAKVSLGIILPLVFILGLFTAIEHARHRALIMNNLSLLASHSGRVVESNLRHAMLKSDFIELQALLDSIGKSGSFRVVYLLDTTGKVIFAPEKKGVGLRLDNRLPDCQPCHKMSASARPASVVVRASDGERVFRSMHLIENSPECMQCHNSEQRIIGLLLTDIPIAPVEAPLTTHLIESLLWWAGTILVVVVVVHLVISRFILRRLENLAAAITGFGQGRLPPSQGSTEQDEIGQLAATFRQMAGQVQARSAENSALSERLQEQSTQRGELLKRLISAQEDERKRVARELHDDLGQALAGLSLHTAVVQQHLQSNLERARQELTQTQALIQEAVNRMYDLILALRPSLLDDLGLASALKAHAERTLQGTGILFQIDSSDFSQRLPGEVETALFRTFQEALHNIVRHSNATQVHIRLQCQDGTFMAEMADNGQGFDPQAIRAGGNSPRGLGLLGMQERVSIVGGTLEILSQPGGGTRLLIQIPF